MISEQPAPFDAETLERLIGEVKPMVDAAGLTNRSPDCPVRVGRAAVVR